jgi:hypothetical protein
MKKEFELQKRKMIQITSDMQVEFERRKKIMLSEMKKELNDDGGMMSQI